MGVNTRALLALPIALALAGAARTDAALTLQPGIGLVAVTGATRGTELVLQDEAQQEVSRGTADAFGSLIFRELAQGGHYAVVPAGGGAAMPFTVLAFADAPDPSLYTGQTLIDGFQYIRTRDGTLLAAMVR